MDLQLQDKVVLVTGGSKGIGEAVVRTFLAEGAQVANINRSTAEGEALQALDPDEDARHVACARPIQATVVSGDDAPLQPVAACVEVVLIAADEVDRAHVDGAPPVQRYASVAVD